MNELKTCAFALVLTLASSFLLANNPGNNFRVSVDNAELSEFSESCLKLESQSRTYSIKLVPNSEGSIMFSIGRHAFRSTYKAKNLYFGVRIQGYKNGEAFLPSFNIDDSYQDLFIDGNFVIFKQIDHPIPVLFEGGADSIKLVFSNSHNFNFHQYLSLNELQVLEKTVTKVNPMLVDCENHSIMIAIQGSNSIDKAERKTISKELMGLFKGSQSVMDSNEVSIMEFGKKVDNISESTDNKEIVSSIKDYKKGAKGKSKAGFTNWGAALDQALERKPDIFIMVTNSWSNYGNQGPATINAQHAELVSKCNAIKANGTRLLFITSGLYSQEKSNLTLLSMLNEDNTNKVLNGEINENVDLKDVDLISMDGFKNFKSMNLSTLIRCEEKALSEVVEE